MLPSEEAFVAAISELDIKNQDKAIIYDGKDSSVHLLFGGKLKSVSSIHFIKMMKPVETCYSVVLLI